MMKYMVIRASDVKHIDFNKVEQTSVDTLRYNNKKTQTFVKWKSKCECCDRAFTKPSFLSKCKDTTGPLTHEQMKEILTYDLWKPEEINDTSTDKPWVRKEVPPIEYAEEE
jgi:hypothetical protein